MLSTSLNHRRTLISIWLVATMLLLLTWWQVVSLVNESLSKEMAAAERDLANLTRVSQEHADRTFRSADQVIRFIQSHYLEHGNKLNLTKLSNQGVIDTEIFPQVGVIDSHGIYTLANRPITTKLDLSDREHFKVHVAADTGELFVSKPVLGRSTGKWSIQLTRRITRPNGEFAGVVVVSIDPGYFTRFYSEIKLGTQGVVALYGLDGIARARKVGDKEEFGSAAINSPMFSQIAKGKLEGSFIHISIVDGVERMYYFRKMPQYQLVVVDGIDTQSLLANHQHATIGLWTQAGAVSLLILALAFALTRHLKNIRYEMIERQMAQARAEDRTEQLNAIFELSPDGFISFDEMHRIKYASPAFHSLTGLSKHSVVGLNEEEFMYQLQKVCSETAKFAGISAIRKRGANEGGLKRQIIEITGKHNRLLEVGLRNSQAQTVSQILYFRDVTQETQIDRMKSEFMSTAAHELRTPMASIYGYSELMLSHDFTEAERREFLQIIHTQSERMVSIISELLDLARIESRKGQDFDLKRLDLSAFLQAYLSSFNFPTGRSAPGFQLCVSSVDINADINKLAQALNNILSNAYKYSPNGGRVDVLMIQPDQSNLSDSVTQRIGIRVLDHGIGMTEQQQSHIFERFYRADTSGRIPGTGLGMSIAQEIVRHHGGEIIVSSQIGAGTSVTIWLPIEQAIHTTSMNVMHNHASEQGIAT